MELYLVWYDDDRRKATDSKIQEAVQAYERRFRRRPNVILVNEKDHIETTAAVRLRPLSYIRPSNFYVGFEEAA